MSTENKFTNGPWHFTFVPNNRTNEGLYQIDALTGTEKFRDRHLPPDIAEVPVHAPNETARAIAKANARLIAAAPELLDALEITLNIIHQQAACVDTKFDAGIAKARAALAKAQAKGEQLG
jgi:hypothetical protein